MKTTGNKILITGGSSGIGLALAKKFLEAGNQVITADRNPEKQAAALAAVPGLQGILCDLSKQEDIDRLVLQIEQQHPDLNVLINNAGVQFNYDLSAEAHPVGRISREIQINLTALMTLSALLLPVLHRQDEAAIVNVSSALAFVPKQNAAVYCATKAGVHSFSKTLRYQLEGSPIRVFELIPTLVDTAMTTGRGSGKMSPATLAEGFFRAFQRNKEEFNAGKVGLLRAIHRCWPGLAERMMRGR